MKTNPQLSEEFRKNQDLEQCLIRLNRLIENIVDSEIEAREPLLPVLLLMGCPRSGTTLFLQWLASCGMFGVPSNLLARFYGNPGFGALVQKILVDLDKEDQLGFKQEAHQFESRLGRSKGATSPSEFWYFWRRYFKHGDTHKLSPLAMTSFDRRGFLSDLAGLENELGRPLAMKGMIANFDIEFLADLSPKFLFVNIKRSPASTVASILRSRRLYCGNEEGWWSFKPPGYHEWLAWSPVEQVAAQVLTMRSCINQSLRNLKSDPARYIEIDHEAFCESPSETADAITGLLYRHGLHIPRDPLLTNTPTFRHPNRDNAMPDNSIEDAISTVRSRLDINEGG